MITPTKELIAELFKLIHCFNNSATRTLSTKYNHAKYTHTLLAHTTIQNKVFAKLGF